MSGGEDAVIPLNTVYRIVWTDPPTIEDFRSNTEMGVPLRRTSPHAARLWDGISVYRTHSQARKTARKYPPWLGRGFIARVVIPANAEVRLERTLNSAGHYTMWADATAVLSWVDTLVPVTPPEA